MFNVQKKYYRPISPNEYLYKHIQDTYDTFAIQFIIEGRGEVSLEQIEEAVKNALKVSPGANLVLDPKNKKWIESNEDIIIRKITSYQDIQKISNLEGELFLKKISGTMGEPAEIILVSSKPYKVIVRIFHGQVDGKGALIFTQNIFKSLRGDELSIANSKETDLSFIKRLNGSQKKINLSPKFRVIKKYKLKSIEKRNIYWEHISIAGNYPSILSKVIFVTNKNLYDDISKFMIPVDLRRHDKNMNSTANMILPLFLEINKGMDWKEINGKLIYSLKNKDEVNLKMVNFPYIMKIPSILLRFSMRLMVYYQKITKKFAISGIISHLGKVDVNMFSSTRFKSEKFYSMPVQQPYIPFSMVICENNQSTEIVFSSYENYIPKVQCQKILKEIENFLRIE